MKKQNIIPILFILFSIFIIISSTTATVTTTGDIWQIINGNTITQNNTNLNVYLGKNSSTSYKLQVDGETKLNGSVDFLNEDSVIAHFGDEIIISQPIELNYGALIPVNENLVFGDAQRYINSSGYIETALMNIAFAEEGYLNFWTTEKMFDSFKKKVISINKNVTSFNHNVTISNNLNVSKNLTTDGLLNVFGYGGINSKFYSYPNEYYKLTISSTNDFSEPHYFKLVTDTSLNITATNIILNGNLNLQDNRPFKFGTGALGVGDFGIFYNPANSSLSFVPYVSTGLSAKSFNFNPLKRDTDFIISGDNTQKVFVLDASLDKINITKVNVTSLLTIPCITTGATLTSYQVRGSLLLNTTSNLIGSYNGSSWRWR